MPDSNDNYKEVYFEAYCPSCKYTKTAETDDPCDLCLSIPYNQNSHKPMYWCEEK